MTDGNRHRVAGSTQQRGFIDGALPMLVKRAVVAQAVLILVVIWSYATWRVYGDKAETLDAARHELRAVAAGMYVHLQAVLNDSLGAARTAVQAIDAQGGVMEVPAPKAAELLARELSSGEYVRALVRRHAESIRRRAPQSRNANARWAAVVVPGRASARRAPCSSAAPSPIRSKRPSAPFPSPCEPSTAPARRCGRAHCSASKRSISCTRPWRSAAARSA